MSKRDTYTNGGGLTTNMGNEECFLVEDGGAASVCSSYNYCGSLSPLTPPVEDVIPTGFVPGI